ncbi:hypothetical protein ANCCEY_12624 [Ancylostoma ceylanicum]|uniref:Uncharacterized protein n=1 Tax=Ancylostoma ceylanicum TaxID=53326 RepID=A0A0D6LEF3_9BILA|nr:hypothetical protein ANCCEY_12624 [Ancylostoma ceylanicum]
MVWITRLYKVCYVDEGLIRSVGVSNYESRHIEEIKSYGKVTNLTLDKDEIESLHKLNRDQHYIRCYGWRVT